MKSQLVRWDARDYGVCNQIVRKFYVTLLYFRFYICNGGKFITLTVFNYEHAAKSVFV